MLRIYFRMIHNYDYIITICHLPYRKFSMFVDTRERKREIHAW